MNESKIIGVHNLADETVNDVLVCDNIKSLYHDITMVDALNKKDDPEAYWFYKIVPSDYKLHQYEP